MKKIVYAVAGIAAAALVGSANAGTLEDVKARGVLKCVVSEGLAGFAFPDDQGNWSGFDIDFCRATAAAVLGDGQKMEAVTSTGKTRFTKLNAGEGDVLWRNTTVTFSRDVGVKLTFLGVNYYDGQGFMAKKDMGVTSALELDGASVCIQTGTTTELNLAEFFSSNDMSYEPVPIETNAEARENYLAGRCDVYTTDGSGLASTRATFDDPNAHVILPEVVSKEPLGPVVREGDDNWADIVSWTLKAMQAGEELGITSANARELGSKLNENPEINRLLGMDPLQGAEAAGLSKDWALNIFAQVGNYEESFDRNLTPLGLSRGMNALARDGGLFYVPPIK